MVVSVVAHLVAALAIASDVGSALPAVRLGRRLVLLVSAVQRGRWRH